MQDSAYIIFIAFGCIWVLMGAIAVIALFKSDGQTLRLGKWGLLVSIPILIPILIALIYQVVRPFFLQHLLLILPLGLNAVSRL
ncbi:MAG: hypothetical protein ACM37W_23945 [Actinomycetota bacterium]